MDECSRVLLDQHPADLEATMTYEVIIEDYVLQCDITHCVSVKGNPNSWASPDDYYGYSEMEFEIVSGSMDDEAGEPQDIGKNGCAAIAERLGEEIEEKLWEQVVAEREDDREYDDRDYGDWEAA
jgi:hypothetical protein